MTASEGAPPSVTAAVINYNGSAYLEEFLQTLTTQTLRASEILFIDNCSTDDSVDFVQLNYPQIRLISLTENMGFARAGNLAVKHSGSDFVALLNTDLRLEPNWLEQLVASVTPDTRIAAVASKMRFYDRPQHLNGVGGAMNRLGYTWDRGMNEEDHGQFDQPSEVLFASAGAALFRRKSFLEVGGFDEAFFMYHEDVDLCWRLWLLGFRVVTAPSAVVYHHFGGATKASKGMVWRELIGERNNMRSLLKNYELHNASRALVRLILLCQPPGRKLDQMKNLLWNLVRLLDTLRLRREIQRRRTLSDNDLAHLIVQSNHVPVRF